MAGFFFALKELLERVNKMSFRIRLSHIFKFILILFIIIYSILNWKSESERPRLDRLVSYKEAGVDYTKNFNVNRKNLNLPIIPANWDHTDSLTNRVQVWENPDTTLPRYAEKTVIADRSAEFVGEEDRYDIKKTGRYFYQLVIKYDHKKVTICCTMRNTLEPERKGKMGGIRYTGEIIDTISFAQAMDTLAHYGLKRLNY